MAKHRGRMPEGVVSMVAAARGTRLRPERGLKIQIATWDARTKSKMRERKQLMTAARKGDPAAIARLAKEFRLRIWFEVEDATTVKYGPASPLS